MQKRKTIKRKMHKRLDRRGAVLLYVTVTMTAFSAVISLGVDVAHVRLVKVELQQAADAAALHAGEVLTGGSTGAQSYAISAALANYADGSSVTVTSSDITYGTWNTSTRVF